MSFMGCINLNFSHSIDIRDILAAVNINNPIRWATVSDLCKLLLVVCC